MKLFNDEPQNRETEKSANIFIKDLEKALNENKTKKHIYNLMPRKI